MDGNPFPPTAHLHPVDIPPHEPIPRPILDRHGVLRGMRAYSGQGGDPRGEGLTGRKGSSGERSQGRLIAAPALRNRFPVVPTDDRRLALATGSEPRGRERVAGRPGRERHQEVASGNPHEPCPCPLVLAFARAAKAGGKARMALPPADRLPPLPRPLP
jgi:hypothetical protein